MTTTSGDRLPRLRAELQLLQGAASRNGEPTWLVHDPLLNRFVQLDAAAYEALGRWQDCETTDDLVRAVNAAGRVLLDQSAVTELVSFLHASQLTEEPRSGGWRHYAGEWQARRHSALGSLIHNYLFFRLPLVRPQAVLERTLPLARLLSGRGALLIYALHAAAGLYLVSRQWEDYFATFQGFLSWEGAALMVFALAAVKAAHELGHAYAAVGHGCRVHTMGIAFVVMAPLLYTDVTDAWRLRDRRKRLQIDSAGIRVELAIAAVALFWWALLPDGALRSLAFTLATVSLASSLVINLNPFMRFDGYYLLAEGLGIENLQSRSFELGRWWLREVLFGLRVPCPETLPPRTIGLLVAYAYAVWIYRLLLFIGIALLVYHYFFKALGIVLFIVEIAYFIAYPIANEIKAWHRMKPSITASPRTLVSAGCAAVALALALVPLSTRVEIPAVVESEKLTTLHPLRNARVVAVHTAHGARVAAGDMLVTLSSPDIDDDLARARISLRLAELQYARRTADAADRESSLVLESTIAGLQARIAGLERERGELRITAPFDGRVVDLNPDLVVGRWVGARDALAVVASPQERLVAKGYLSEDDLWRLDKGAKGIFIPEHAHRAARPVEIRSIAAASARFIDIAELASTHSGRIAVAEDEKGRLAPTSAHYLVHMSVPADGGSNDLSFRGLVIAEGQPESLLARLWRQVLQVVMREATA